MSNKLSKWKTLSPAMRVVIAVGGLVQFALLFVARRDLKRRPAEEIRGSKGLWRPVLLINFVGPLLYLIVGRKR